MTPLEDVADQAHHTAQRLGWKKVAESGSHTDSSGTQLKEGRWSGSPHTQVTAELLDSQ